MAFFRFCDLPKEIRILIYEECFPPTGLHIWSRRRFTCTHSSYLFHTGEAPLLRVCKLIRQESRPVFAQSIHRIESFTYDLHAVPQAYLTYVTGLELRSTLGPLFNERMLPNLQTLRIRFRAKLVEVFGPFISSGSKDEIHDSVVIVATYLLRGRYSGSGSFSNLHDELERIRSKKRLPFRVLLDIPHTFRYEPSTGEFKETGKKEHRCRVQVDWEKQEVVEGWPFGAQAEAEDL